jgi:hypothetical protein
MNDDNSRGGRPHSWREEVAQLMGRAAEHVIAYGQYDTGGNSVNQPGCPYCGLYGHTGVCPRVASIEYYPNGTVKRVELRVVDGSLSVTGSTEDTK